MIFEMALLHAISDFNEEKDHTLQDGAAQNQSEVLELTPKQFKTFVNLVKGIPIKNVAELNTTNAVTHDTQNGKAQENNLKKPSKINSILQKIYLNGSILKIVNGKSLLHHLPQKVTIKESSGKETKSTNERLVLVGILDVVNTSQANNNVGVTVKAVTQSVPQTITAKEETEPNDSPTQMAEEINNYLQNELLANKTAEIMSAASVHGHEHRLSVLMEKLDKMVVKAPREFTENRKKELQMSEHILLRILNLSSTVLKELNGQLSGNPSPNDNKAEQDKYSFEDKELAMAESEWEDADQLNHYVQMFYQLEENLSNLKIFLEDYNTGEKLDMVERLLDHSLSVVTQLEQIPWLKGRNSYIDFELEALRDFAGILSNVESIPHDPRVGST
ncbi:uncharacterized protein LOC116991635 [Amblyraja radiata]|uniref:uncharacterized protein LOC116991635 n=1 Tax=Amblyraja radiata TaxID=386614 RepID=UPI0014042513|nr:uncharacterized protein LOC116991635 [Amblyraja radiata]